MDGIEPLDVPTLGWVARRLQRWKARGVTRGAVLFAVGRVWYEEGEEDRRLREVLRGVKGGD